MISSPAALHLGLGARCLLFDVIALWKAATRNGKLHVPEIHLVWSQCRRPIHKKAFNDHRRELIDAGFLAPVRPRAGTYRWSEAWRQYQVPEAAQARAERVEAARAKSRAQSVQRGYRSAPTSPAGPAHVLKVATPSYQQAACDSKTVIPECDVTRCNAKHVQGAETAPSEQQPGCDHRTPAGSGDRDPFITYNTNRVRVEAADSSTDEASALIKWKDGTKSRHFTRRDAVAAYHAHNPACEAPTAVFEARISHLPEALPKERLQALRAQYPEEFDPYDIEYQYRASRRATATRLFEQLEAAYPDPEPDHAFTQTTLDCIRHACMTTPNLAWAEAAADELAAEMEDDGRRYSEQNLRRYFHFRATHSPEERARRIERSECAR